MSVDWYERRNELACGQIYRLKDGDIVRLDRRKPGDGTQWIVDEWFDGWSSYETGIEPGDLSERLPDTWQG